MPAVADMHQLRYQIRVIEYERKYDDAYIRLSRYMDPPPVILRNRQAPFEFLWTEFKFTALCYELSLRLI